MDWEGDLPRMTISNVAAAYQAAPVTNNAAPKSAAPSTPAAQPQDTVKLSAAALAASGDADHDGDSH